IAIHVVAFGIMCTTHEKVVAQQSADGAFVDVREYNFHVVQHDVFVRRMEEIDARVVYNSWKRMYVTGYVRIDVVMPSQPEGSN
ncbi:hypothetical protein Tco_1306030, partial [Tanacetum coccineum]